MTTRNNFKKFLLLEDINFSFATDKEILDLDYVFYDPLTIKINDKSSLKTSKKRPKKPGSKKKFRVKREDLTINTKDDKSTKKSRLRFSRSRSISKRLEKSELELLEKSEIVNGYSLRKKKRLRHIKSKSNSSQEKSIIITKRSSKKPKKFEENEEKILTKNLPSKGFITISDIIAQQNQKKKSINGISDEDDQSSGSVINEQELNLRRQINEDRIRKIIGRIDAPSYSIDQKIVYFKDVDNVAHREDIFEDLMGKYFTMSPKKTAENITNTLNNNNVNPTFDNFIMVHEDNEMEQEEETFQKIPAFKFPKKNEEEHNEWLQKRWSLNKNPNKIGNFINSVSNMVWEDKTFENYIEKLSRCFLKMKFV